jgi:glycosyltransferase involved in cell wall biosynthesis
MADSPNDFVHQTERLLDSATLRSRFALAGRELVERRYSWHVVGANLLAAYEAAAQVTAKQALA